MDLNNLNMDDLIPKESSFLKVRNNGLLLSDEDIEILDEYEIDYHSCKNMKELLFKIEEAINNTDSDGVLEELSLKIGECNYYNYTNK